MGYISKMRSIVGHEPILVCVCGCLIFNEMDQVLLQRRSDDGLWGNPGGSMELGETIYETVMREVKEETGLILNENNLEIFKIYSGEKQHHIYPNGDEVYFINIIFQAKLANGDIKKNFESKELRFFDLDKLPTDVTGPFAQVRDDLHSVGSLFEKGV